MDRLQNVVIAAETVFLVMAFCSIIKAACQKILKRN